MCRGGRGGRGRGGGGRGGRGGRQPGLFQAGGGGGSQGDHVVSHALTRQSISQQMETEQAQGRSQRQAASAVVRRLEREPGRDTIADLPREDRQRHSAALRDSRASNRRLSSVPGQPSDPGDLRDATDRLEAVAQLHPQSAVRFGSTGGGEGHGMNQMRGVEAELAQGNPATPQRREIFSRGLARQIDAQALGDGIEAQDEAMHQGDDRSAHFPGVRLDAQGRVDRGRTEMDVSELVTDRAAPAFPHAAHSFGRNSMQNAALSEIRRGGQRSDPDFELD